MTYKCHILKCYMDFQNRAALHQHQHSIHYCSHTGCLEKFPDSESRRMHMQTPHQKGKTSGETSHYTVRIATNKPTLSKGKKSARQSNTLDNYISAKKESSGGGKSLVLSVQDRKSHRMKPYDHASKQHSTMVVDGE